MATDYTPILLDMLAAFGASTFYYAHGSFQHSDTYIDRCWRHYNYTHRVACAPQRRDALIRQGWIREVRSELCRGGYGMGYRLTDKALDLADETTAAADGSMDWLREQPSRVAFIAACREQDALPR
jgi:hypothetical protein